MVISEKFIDVLCTCEDCEKSFSRIKKLIHAMENRDPDQVLLENNLDGEVNQEDQSDLGTDE